MSCSSWSCVSKCYNVITDFFNKTLRWKATLKQLTLFCIGLESPSHNKI